RDHQPSAQLAAKRASGLDLRVQFLEQMFERLNEVTPGRCQDDASGRAQEDRNSQLALDLADQPAGCGLARAEARSGGREAAEPGDLLHGPQMLERQVQGT